MKNLALKILGCGVFLVAAIVVVQERTSDVIPLLGGTEKQEKSREVLKGEEVVKALGIKKGDVVGCIEVGSGPFVLPIAKEVGEKGLVYVEDVQGGILSPMAKEITGNGVDNVQFVLGEPENPAFPEGFLDVAIMRSAYSDTYSPFTKLRKLYNISKELKPGGRLAIINWSPIVSLPGGSAMKALADEQKIIGEVESAGFHLVQRYSSWPEKFFLVFKKGS